MDDISEVFFYPELVILANSIGPVLLESAFIFCNFATSIRDDDCKQETPALSSVKRSRDVNPE